MTTNNTSLTDERLWWEKTMTRLNVIERERLLALLARVEAAEKRGELAAQVLQRLAGKVTK